MGAFVEYCGEELANHGVGAVEERIRLTRPESMQVHDIAGVY
jgi:hypothetical protein